MLLHDSYFSTSNRTINSTHYSSVTTAHSLLFRSTSTLIISIFGMCSNFMCIIYLSLLISKSQQRKLLGKPIERVPSVHVLAHEKYKFLVILTSNDFLLCLLSIISCLDEKYYFQSLIASYRLCSLHIFLWKLTLHFTPLLTIFILFRYHYVLYKKFPSKYFSTTTFNQLFCTDLCTLIPFVVALAWSIDGLWLWGESSMNNPILPTRIDYEQNETVANVSMISYDDQTTNKSKHLVSEHFYQSEQTVICHLQTNDDMNLTTRVLYLIQADFLLLFSLHLIGFCLEIVLHIRLTCCSIAKTITSSFRREQQLSLYILFIFICLTSTSLPFYFYRTVENLFDSYLVLNQYEFITSLTLSQILLFGICFKPILYFLLLSPSRFLLRSRCFTSTAMETNDRRENILLNEQEKHHLEQSGSSRYSLRLTPFRPKMSRKLRTLSHPIPSTANRHSMIIMDQNPPTSNGVPI